MQAAYRQYVRREWDKFLGEKHQGNWRIEFERPDLPAEVTPQNMPHIQDEVIREGRTRVLAGSKGNGQGHEPAVIAPITLRGEVLGTLSLLDIDPNREWTDEEITLVETVSEQLGLTLENVRLFDDTQQRATREQLTREITDKMRASPDVGSIIQTGLAELTKALGVSRSYVKLTAQLEELQAQANDDQVSPKELKRNDDIEEIRERLKQGGQQNWLDASGGQTQLSPTPAPPNNVSDQVEES